MREGCTRIEPRFDSLWECCLLFKLLRVSRCICDTKVERSVCNVCLDSIFIAKVLTVIGKYVSNILFGVVKSIGVWTINTSRVGFMECWG